MEEPLVVALRAFLAAEVEDSPTSAFWTAGIVYVVLSGIWFVIASYSSKVA